MSAAAQGSADMAAAMALRSPRDSPARMMRHWVGGRGGRGQGG